MSDAIRGFIAVEISSEIKSELAGFVNTLKAARADVKWTDPQKTHVTIKFLGDFHPDKIDAVSKSMVRATHQFQPFSLHLGTVGAFPKPTHPRIVWVGIQDTTGHLKRLANDLEIALEELGFQPEKREFSAHITIGRVRSGQGRQTLVQALSEASFSSRRELAVDSLILFQSTLTQTGPLYTKLKTVFLGGNA